jgi:hypothetical protein
MGDMSASKVGFSQVEDAAGYSRPSGVLCGFLRGQQFLENVTLESVRFAGDRFSEGKIQTRVYGCPFLVQNALGEGLGCFHESRVIEQDQGGQRCVGVRTLSSALLSTGGVEGLHHRMEKLSLPMNVDTSTPLTFIFVVVVLAGREIEMPIIASGLVRLDACSAHLPY